MAHRGCMAGAVGALCATLWTASLLADPIPPTLVIRLMGPLSARRSQPGDPVSAVTVTALVVDGRIVASPGCTLPGIVGESLRSRGVHKREVIALAFSRLIDRDRIAHALQATVIEVDNGRETVDRNGRILGLAPVRKKPGTPDALMIATSSTQLVRALVSRAVGRMPAQIDYKAGAELVLRVDQLPADSSIVCGPVTPVMEGSEELSRIVNAQPFRTSSKTGDKLSDATNLMFIGSRDDLFAAFAAAGWVSADRLSPWSRAKMFVATFAGGQYSSGPVSPQSLDGRPPDAVFEKQLNTFAKRHHVRVWQRGDTLGGQPVWIAAATHDTAFVASRKFQVFTHSIDANLDDERSKIVSDLSFAGVVASETLVARPLAPRQIMTSIGEVVHTDGQAAVIVLKKQ